MKIFRKHSLLCLLIILLGGNAAVKSFSFDKDKFSQDADFLSRENDRFIDYRLPTSVKPIKYDIQLQQNSWDNDDFTFLGYIYIHTKIINATNNITLHVGKLEIITSTVEMNEKTVPIIDTKYDNVTEKYTFVLSDTLKPEADVKLYFEYRGQLADNMIGFYRSSYTEDEQIKWLAATQFQTTHARHAFPCFDEPSFKATFNIKILRYVNYTSLSNMPLANSILTNEFSLNPNQDMILDEYENSVPMSTYLVAFVISQFRSLSTKDGRFRVWARPAVIEQARYALKIGPMTLELLGNLFEQKYNLPKMDMVAMPDFAAGAMENWGLATYRETRMLYDEKESSVLAQQSVASVIVHEMTHMWFGNLVTPEWWGYLWLSEGFARFFQYFATAQIEKDWNMREQFVVAQHQVALMVDSVKSSRPLTREVSTAAQIATVGDSITYAKGASIIRMMAFTFGEDLFELALRDYLRSNKDRGLVNPDNLWKAIEDRINKKNSILEIPTKVKIIMDSWTLQAGYPVVSVTIKDTKIHVTQERFLSTNLDETPINATWWVPLSWTTRNDLNFDDMSTKYWLFTKEYVIDLEVDPDWVIFNIQSSGFYRVKYDSMTWLKIFRTLNSKEFNKIHVLNRASIMDDLLNLARAGFESYRIALNGLDYLKWETNYLPFKAALNGLDYVNRRFAGMKGHFLLERYILSLIDDRRKQLGYEDRPEDDRLTVLLRQELNSWACKLGDKECTTTYVNKFKKWRANASFPIHPNERATVYCAAIRNGTWEDWKFLWDKYFHSNHADDQLVMLNALACSLNTTVLEKYLLYAISGYKSTRIRKQDSTSVFAAVYGSSLIGAEYVLDFVEKHHELMEKYWEGQNTIATILNGASQRFSTFRLVDKFREFCERHKTKLATIIESLTASLTTAQRELKWYLSASRSIVPLLRAYAEASMRDVMPREYFVRLKPHLVAGNFTVDGHVTIEADVKRETKRIVLHSRGMQHHAVSIKANKVDVKVINRTKIEQDDYYTIDVSESLPVGTKLTIDVMYMSHLNASELLGFYKGSYTNGNEKRWFAATHLEPIGARNMFPCFDMPSAKATFTLQVDVAPDYYPISNTPWQKQEKLNDGRMRYTFFETPKMSTYLVGLVVSDLELKSAGRNQVLNVYARANAINQTEYAASVISPLLDFFEKMLERKYELPKLNMIALPDLPSTAGDNWGLVTFRETNLLYDATHSPFTSMQTIRSTIAREIAHQWFGNLVTPANWVDLWLKEGFGGYLEYHAPAHVFNDTTLEAQFVVDQMHSALRTDGSRSTRALSPDELPNDIRSMYDVITYAKGASVLRMMDKSFGNTVFRGTLRDYIDNEAYNVVTPGALYYALEARVKKAGLQGWDNVINMFARWTTQPGYPVLHVSVNEDVVTLRQERFLLETYDRESVTDSLWHIPITWASVDNRSEYLNTTPSFWMTTRQATFHPSNSLFTLNAQQSGYYRVNYDAQHWIKLIECLTNGNFSEIHEINRAALIDDLMNLARADYVSYELAIRATMYLRHEDRYLPWRAFYDNLPYLNNRFRGRGIENLYKIYVKSIITPLYELLGFRDRPDDDYLTKLLRMHTRKWACELDIADCKSEAASYFSKKHFSKMVPADYRGVVYCTAMQTDTTRNTYDILWKKYSDSNVATDKLVILGSLACSRNKEILGELLREAIRESSSIQFHNSEKIFLDIADASLNGTETVMSVIGDYYDDVRRHFGGYGKIKGILSVLASRLSTYDLYKQYQSLLDQLVKKEPALNKVSLLRQAKFELDWYDKMMPVIFEVLDKLFSSDEYRLPRTLYPEYYNVRLVPHMEKGTFDGQVQIFMRVEEETTVVVVNVRDLSYDSINVYRHYKPGHDNPNAEEIPLRNYREYRDLQQLRIYLTEPVKTMYLMAEIKFTGILGDDMKGFYRSSYVDSNGTRHWLATTQFEPTHARRAFPCFDEPAFKSKFIINVQRPNHYTTLSNMPILNNISTTGNYTWDRFVTNEIPMSTYLVAFVVSEFKRVNESEPFLNVWGRPEIAMYGQFAQDTGKLLINALANFTDMDYQLPKLDLVGIPDFDMGAMENWGLATFREHGLFHDKKEIAASQEKYIIAIIAHELAHMWFGNLVTCEWWEYLWLNEGFAQYFEWFASDMILPDYKFMDQFVVYELHPALLKDSISASVRPMTSPVKTPEQINDIFDYVNYGKAASVLRMIFNTLEPTVHASAIQSYLEQRKHGTTRPEDLWRSFDQHATIEIDYKNVSFAKVMDTWTNQPGYPVVNAVLNDDTLILTQKRFLMNEWTLSPEKRSSHAEQFYWIPYDIVTSIEPYTRLSLKKKGWLGREARFVYINPTNNWFIVNRQQTGFYRVNYDAASWRQLIDTLMDRNRFHSIHVLNRAQIVDDLFNLARATHVEYALLLNATRYLAHETHHVPWRAFFNGLSYVHERLDRQDEVQGNLTKYVLKLMSDTYNGIGFNARQDDHLDRLNREMFLQWACKLNEKKCTQNAKSLFADWRADASKRISPDARAAVYCTAIRTGTADDWQFLWRWYLQTNFAAERNIIIKALGCSTNAMILQDYLWTAVDEYDAANATFRKQDIASVFSSVYSASQLGVNVALDFLIDNIKEITDTFSSEDMVASLFNNVASHISHEEQYRKLTEFVARDEKMNSPVIKVNLAPAIRTARINLMWYNRNRDPIEDWIKEWTLEQNGSNKSSIEKSDNNRSTMEQFNAHLIIITIIVAIAPYFLNYH